MTRKRDVEDLRQFVTFCNSHAEMESGQTLFLSGGSKTAMHASTDIDYMFLADDVIALTPERTDLYHRHQKYCKNTLDLLWIYTTSGVHCGHKRLMKQNGQNYTHHELGSIISDIDSFEGPAFTVSDDLCDFTGGLLLQSWKSSHLQALGEALGEEFYSFSGYDIVPCIPSPLWPEDAGEWTTRRRRYGSPSQLLIDQCVAAGCHFVAKAHVKSTYPEIEFRYSFSVAEDILVSSWNHTQVSIYNTLKGIKTVANKQFAVHEVILCSYHLKTLMLWAIESKPPEFWTERSSATQLLVNELIEWLISKSCPHYFIVNNNLFDSIENNTNLEKLVSSLFAICQRLAESPEDISQFIPTKLEHFVSNILYYFPLSNAITFEVVREYGSLSKLNSLLELYGLYAALILQRELLSRSETLSSTDYQNGLQIVERLFQKAMEPDDRDVVVSFHNGLAKLNPECKLVKTFVCQLHPSKWERISLDSLLGEFKRGSGCASSISQRKEGEIGTSESNEVVHGSPVLVPSNVVKAALSLWDSEIGFSDRLDVRISKCCSAVYMANFCFAVCHDYRKAIDLCNEVNSAYQIGKPSLHYICIHIEHASLFDEDIQSLVGLVQLYEALYHAASGKRLSHNPSFLQFYLLDFAQYLRLRCYQKLLLTAVDNNDKLQLQQLYVEALREFVGRSSSWVYPSPYRPLLLEIIERIHWSEVGTVTGP